MAVGSALKKATKIVTKGVKAEANRDYKEAVRLYELSEGFFFHAMKYDAIGEEAKELILKKCNMYTERANLLRTYEERKNISGWPDPYKGS